MRRRGIRFSNYRKTLRALRNLATLGCVIGAGAAAASLGGGSPHLVASQPDKFVDTLPTTTASTTATSVSRHSATAERGAAPIQRRTPERASRSATTSAPAAVSIDGMPRQLRRIGGCESSGAPDAPIDWKAQNRTSSASGGFQIIDSTWRSWAKSYGAAVEASQYARAVHAPPSVQLHVALAAWRAQGPSPWNESRSCWA